MLTRTTFAAFALDCSPTVARDIALAMGIQPAVIDLWEHSLDQYRKAHHYPLNDVVLAARSIH